MDLSGAQRWAALAGIAVALAGLGAFLLAPGNQRAPGGAPAPGRSAVAPAGGRATGPPATPVATPSASPSATSVNIYGLVPFTPSGLSQAAAVARRFATAYGTYSYRESAAGYAAAMRGLAVTELVTVLARGYQTPGVASARLAAKQISTATVTVRSLSSFGPSSLTFVVDIVQAIAAAHGHSRLAGAYAVTVARAGSGWLVTNIQLATQGNT